MNREFWEDTAYRCAWTFAEALLACMSVGQAITDINWMHSLSIAAGAALITLLKQIVRGAKEHVGADVDDVEFDAEADDVREDIETEVRE